MGSVKDLEIIKQATDTEMGVGVFYFTDDYSIFDYGKMPDIIPKKGEALCLMAQYNFQELEKMGIKSHMRKLVETNKMEVNLVRVINPEQQKLTTEMNNYLIPLEVIYRNSLPTGSSVFKRIDKGETTLEQLGLEHPPMPGEKLEKPILDVSTKLEPVDRYITWEEAQSLSGLTDQQLEELKEKTMTINNFISKKATELGIDNADGKFEFGLTPNNEIILVDVLGTPDECRFLYKGNHVNKQVLRDYYKKTSWYQELETAKEKGLSKSEYPRPIALPKEMQDIVSNIYKSVCEAWIEKRIWNAPPLEEVINSYKAYIEML